MTRINAVKEGETNMELNKDITKEREEEQDYFVYFYKGEKVGMYLPEISVGGYLHEGRTWMITEKSISEEEFIRLLEKENSK